MWSVLAAKLGVWCLANRCEGGEPYWKRFQLLQSGWRILEAFPEVDLPAPTVIQDLTDSVSSGGISELCVDYRVISRVRS